MADRRELYRSPQGDCWFLGRDPSSGRAIVIHEEGRPSEGGVKCIDLSVFLARDVNGPEHQALLRLIATLIDVPPYGETSRT